MNIKKLVTLATSYRWADGSTYLINEVFRGNSNHKTKIFKQNNILINCGFIL